MHEAQGFLGDFGPAGSPQTLSKKGFAELLGVTPGRVSQMITAGLPVEPNGRINVAKGRAWVRANVDPNRRRPGHDDDPPSYRSPRAEKDAAEAMTARLKAEKLAGNLIDRATTLRAIETRARMERDAWIAWVNRAASDLANATGAEMPDLVAGLDRLVRDQLASLAEMSVEGIDP